MSALGIATRGLVDPSALSVATRGLIQEVQGLALAGISALRADRATDVRMVLEEAFFGADVAIEDGQLASDHGLLTAVVISVFSDRLAERDDVLPGGSSDRRGWWGDGSGAALATDDRIGSRLWLLSREKQTNETRLRAIQYVEESLGWLLEDAVASAVSVEGEWIQRGVLGLQVGIERPADTAALIRFAVTWEGV